MKKVLAIVAIIAASSCGSPSEAPAEAVVDTVEVAVDTAVVVVDSASAEIK